MPILKPVACRREAFQFLESQLPTLQTNTGLLRAATAISMHELGGSPAARVEQTVSGIAGRIRGRVTGDSRKALLAHLHEELFERRRFRGNVEDYYNPRNSYLSCVIETGQGIPITLSMIYSLVARRIGLRADGINAPGHFLVQVTDGSKPMLVDPFFGGDKLSRDDARQRIEGILESASPRQPIDLRPASHRDWIIRMLNNLILVFHGDGREQDADAMNELKQLVTQSLC